MWGMFDSFESWTVSSFLFSYVSCLFYKSLSDFWLYTTLEGGPLSRQTFIVVPILLALVVIKPTPQTYITTVNWTKDFAVISIGLIPPVETGFKVVSYKPTSLNKSDLQLT